MSQAHPDPGSGAVHPYAYQQMSRSYRMMGSFHHSGLHSYYDCPGYEASAWCLLDNGSPLAPVSPSAFAPVHTDHGLSCEKLGIYCAL